MSDTFEKNKAVLRRLLALLEASADARGVTSWERGEQASIISPPFQIFDLSGGVTQVNPLSSHKTIHWIVLLGRVLSNTSLKSFAHVPYRETFSDI